MTFDIVTIIFTLISWAAFGFLYLIIAFIVLLPVISPYWNYKENQKWLKWETLEQYWVTHPDCKTSNGTKCYHCGSHNVRQYGFKESSDGRRLHQCNQCSVWLYRSGNK